MRRLVGRGAVAVMKTNDSTCVAESLIQEHGVFACAQAILRLIQTGDVIQVCNHDYAAKRTPARLTLSTRDRKDLHITEGVNHYESGCSVEVWKSAMRRSGRRSYPLVNQLLRDIESELTVWIISPYWRSHNTLTTILARATP